MNFLSNFILLATISSVPFAAAANKCETAFTIDRGRNDGHWPSPGECKISRLIIKDDSPALTNHDNPDPEEGFAEMKVRFAPLSNLQGKLADRPRIAVEIKRFFTPSYNKNMNRINALLEALNISSAEVFGLAQEKTPPSSFAEKALIFAMCAPLSYKAFSHRNAGWPVSRILALHSLMYPAVNAVLYFSFPKPTFWIVAPITTAVYDLLSSTGLSTYHTVIFVAANGWSNFAHYLGFAAPLPNAYHYCIGGKPYHIGTVDPDDYMKGFYDSRLSPLCQLAFAG